jgi:hypothetical protein
VSVKVAVREAKAPIFKEIDLIPAAVLLSNYPVGRAELPGPIPPEIVIPTRSLVITGFNTDIKHKGVTYHVQTEDKGLDSPLILSLVYVGGAIIASKRTPYEDLVAAGFDEKALTERLQRQHKLICAAIRAGRVEELKRMAAPNGSTEPRREEKQQAEPPAIVEPANKNGKSVEVTAGKEEAALPATASSNGKSAGVKNVDAAAGGAESELIFQPANEFVFEFESTKASEPETKPGSSIEIITSLIDEISALDNGPVIPASDYQPQPRVAPLIHEELVVEDTRPAYDPVLPLDEAGGEEWQDDADDLYLSLLDDEGDFRGGQLVLIRAYVGRGTQGHWPMIGAQVTVKILGTTFRPLIQTTETDERGIAVVRAHLPSFKSGRAAIIVRAADGDDAVELRRVIHQ